MFAALKKLLSSPSPAQQNSAALPDAWQQRLHAGQAAALREDLEMALAGDKDFPLAALLAAAQAAGWSEQEQEKLAAWGEYFSGQVEQAHHRVSRQNLAARDYALFMKACGACYHHDRFAEGYALLKGFRGVDAEDFDPLRFYDLAGFMAFCGAGDVQEACRYYDTALATGQLNRQLAVNSYIAYFEAGRDAEVGFLRNELQAHCADDAQALYALAYVELANDNYPEGFRLAEARYQIADMAPALGSIMQHKPRWQGEDLAGKRILIRGEQGHGDLIMMARYFPLLNAQGATLIVECLGAVISLLETAFPYCQFVDGGKGEKPAVDFDVWTGLMSLPHHFSTTATTVPATTGYLHVPAEHLAYWRTRVAEAGRAKKMKVGVAWAGNPRHRYDKRRSLPFDLLAVQLERHPDIDFFALQTQTPQQTPDNLIDLSAEMLTFADTAAIIEQMDLIITVDTSVVHLAGALGKPAWLLLPHRYEWRWRMEGETNYWYETVSVLRQSTHGDWAGLLVDVFDRRLPFFLISR